MALEEERHDDRETDTRRIPHRDLGSNGERRREVDRFPEAGVRSPGEGTVRGPHREDPPRGGHAGGLDRAVERRDGGVEAGPGPAAPVRDGHRRDVPTALKAGATSLREPMDAFYGDRTAGVKDSFGNSWWIATHQEDVSREELDKRAEAEMKK